jgi:hypothetical protein
MMADMSLCLTLDTAGLVVVDVVVTNLGVLFDKTLSGKDQVNHVAKQVFLRLRQLQYFSYLISPSIKIKLVKSLVLPVFDYVDSVSCEISVGLDKKLNIAFGTIVIEFVFLGVSTFASLLVLLLYINLRLLWLSFRIIWIHQPVHLKLFQNLKILCRTA